MRLRFKLRTFLLITMLFALPAGYYGKRVASLTKESRALTRLDRDWTISVNRVLDNSQTAFREKSRSQEIIDWPITSLLNRQSGSESLFRVSDNTRSLWLYESLNAKDNSLVGIEHLRQLKELKLYHNPATSSGIQIKDDEFRHLAKLNQLEILSIHNCHVNHRGLAHLSDLKLRKMYCGSKHWSSAELNELGNLTTLEQLSVFCYEFDMGPLKNLTKLKHLAIYIRANGKLEGIEHLPQLESMMIRGSVSRKHLIELRKAKRLNRLEFMDFTLPNEAIDQLLTFPALEEITFTYGLGISTSEQAKLESTGIKVNVIDLPTD